jgi:uncharacterized caspase-like protein
MALSFAPARGLRVALALLMSTVAADALAASRNALVIGNSSYRPGYELKNPIADARGVAESLSKVGFDVVILEDTDLASIQRAIDVFVGKSAQGEAAVIYYAGHGARINNRDFLLPVDFSMATFDQVDTEAFDVDRLVQALAATRSDLKLLLFDACRNNPLEDRGAMALKAPEKTPQYGANTMTVYATAQGMKALDGLGDHSPFAEGLMENIADPQIELNDLIRKVTVFVRDKTAGRQTTYQQGSLDKSFYLGRNVVATGVVAGQASEPIAQLTGLVFDDSDRRELTDADLQGKDAATLRLARNEIFARHNRRFADPALARHFGQFDWYRPGENETRLSKLEIANVEAIRRYELKPAIPESDFLLPDSDRRLLTKEDLQPLSKEQLRVARNEIYARRGWDFKTKAMETYFEQFDWYTPSLGKIELSHIEQQNVDFIVKFERTRS